MKKITILLFVLLTNSSFSFSQSEYELRFDGDDDYVEISGLLGNQANITLSAWAKVSSNQRGEVISLGDHVAIRLNDSNAQKGFFYKSDGGWHGTGVDSTLSPGWHFFTYTNYDSSSNRIQKFYINGNQVARSAETSAINYSGLGTNTRIGIHGSNNTYADFHGSIHEVAVWSSGLDSLEVLALFNNGTPLDKKSNSGNYSSSDKLVAYWKFSEGTGTTLADATDNDHDGTITNATWNPRYSNTIGNLKVKGFDIVGDRLYAVHPGTNDWSDKIALISIINLNTNAVIASGGEMSTTTGGFNGYPDQIAVFGQVGVVGEDLKMFDFSQDKVEYMCRNILSTKSDCSNYNYLSKNSMHMQKYKNKLYVSLQSYGFAVFDMSDPKNPVTLHMKDYELENDYPYGIHANDDYIFVCDTDGDGKIYIHKNGGDFEKVGTINTKAYRAASHGDLLYTDHKKVFNISDPANPVEVTGHNYTGESSNGEMRIKGDYLLISGGGHKSWANPRASIYNIKESSDIKLAYTFDDTLPSYDIMLTKDKLYVSFGTQGTDMGSLRIYNNKFVDPSLFNSSPLISAISDVTINEDETGTVTLTVTDDDGDATTLSAVSDTSAITATVSGSTLTLTPELNWHGTAKITVSASDGSAIYKESFALTVGPINDRPILTIAQNTSLNFDGTDDYVDLGKISSTNFTKADFSIQTWVKTTSTKAQSILVKGDGDGAWEAGEKALYIENAGYPWFVGYDNEYIPGTGLKVNDGLWHHIVATWDYSQGEDGIAAIYVDSVKATVGTSYRAKTADNSTDRLYLGKAEAYEAQNYFDGNIDQVAIWNKALSALEVAALYNSSNGISATANSGDYMSSSNLQAYWSIDEGSGTTINDISTKNTAGTISGATWKTDSGVASENFVTDEEKSTKIKLSAFDVDGDALAYTATADTSALTLSVLADTLEVTPGLNYTGTSVITVIVSDNALTDTAKFDLKVININDSPIMAAIANDTTSEDSDGKVLKLSASDVDGDALTYLAFSDTLGLTVSVSNDTIKLKPVADYFGTSKVTAIVNDGAINDSSTFSFTVLNVQDKPYPFEWVSTPSDTIYITKENIASNYILEWTESKEVDNEVVDYFLYAQIGVYGKEEILDTVSTKYPIPYSDILEGVFEGQPMNAATVRFSIKATDGIDTIDVTGDDRVLYVNRYQYLSTLSEVLPTEYALHENYPNPFNPTTTLRFDIPEVSNMTLTIYNMLGQKVRFFEMNNIDAGYHTLQWNARNDNGDPVSTGLYIYQMHSKEFVKTRKMIFLK